MSRSHLSAARDNARVEEATSRQLRRYRHARWYARPWRLHFIAHGK